MQHKLNSTIGLTILATLAVAVSATAGSDHHALNGTWVLNPAKSTYSGVPVVQTGTVEISDHTGVIVISRNFKYEGKNETFFYRDSAGSEHDSTIHSGKDLKSKTSWEHDVLTVTTTKSGLVTTEGYSLAADGTMIVNVTTPDHKTGTLVFQRK